jgi:hypothetical protein
MILYDHRQSQKKTPTLDSQFSRGRGAFQATWARVGAGRCALVKLKGTYNFFASADSLGIKNIFSAYFGFCLT